MRLVLAAFLCAATALACTSNTTTANDTTEIDEHDAAALRGASALEGNLAVGSSLTVSYDHGEGRYPRDVPYLGVEIRPDTAAVAPGALQEITVTGNFPGTPHVVVVDEKFNVLATSTAATRQADGSSIATVLAPRQSTRLVLVRDPLWSKSMKFDVRVGK